VKNLFYFELHEAEKLRNTYTSWIGKEAHVGKGITEKLREIQIRPRNGRTKKPEKLYHVDFVFDNKIFSAHEFLFHNSLHKEEHPLINSEKKNSFPL
jgi:hypothetical protein